MTSPLHLSNTCDWYTPSWLVELARATMGSIDLDPASCYKANETVKAYYYMDAEVQALRQSWYIGSSLNVFLNPPSGKHDGKSMPKAFWNKLMETRNAGVLKQAIFVCFSIEQLQVLQNATINSIGNFTVCIPNKRVRYVSPEGNFSSPTHGTAIVYVDGTEDNTYRFTTYFSEIGSVYSPR